jgi:lipoate-protein ligase A
MHEWIRAALARLLLATELAPAGSKTLPGQCFQGHEMFDLLWRGRKIAGAAQRRTRDGLLIQGSVQARQLSLARADWEKAMCDVARDEQGAGWSALEPDTPLTERALALVRVKYSQAAYNRKR